MKPWYDHIGGDAIGLTWNKHNSKVRNLLSVLLQTKTKGKIITNVMFDCRNENEMKRKKKVIQWRC